MKLVKILFSLFLLLSFNLFGQPKQIYTDIKKALKNPEKVYQLNLKFQTLKKSEILKI